jgi:hypothetical protein
MSTTVDKGRQDVSIHWFQDATSSNVNQLFLGLFKAGIYRGGRLTPRLDGVEGPVYALEAGTTLMFKSSRFEDDRNKEFLVKINTNEEVLIPFDWAQNTYRYIICNWQFDEADGKYFADFYLSTTSPLPSDQHFVLAEIENITAAYAAQDYNQIHLDYSLTENRYLMENLFGVNNQFGVHCSTDGLNVYVKPGRSYIRGSFTEVDVEQTLTPPADISTGEVDESLNPSIGQFDLLYLNPDGTFYWTSIPYFLTPGSWMEELTNKRLTTWNSNMLIAIFQRPLSEVAAGQMFSSRLKEWNPFTPIIGFDQTNDLEVSVQMTIPVEE